MLQLQITSVPLPPPLPVDEHRSAFVALPQTSLVTSSKLRDLPQPINLSLSEQISTRPMPSSDTVIDDTVDQIEVMGLPKAQTVQPAQTQYRSVIQSALKQQCKPEQSLNFQSQSAHARPQNYTNPGLIDWTDYGRASEPKDTCAVRLMHLAQRAQNQQRLLSPVKEATDALMLLQDTASF